MDIFRPNAPAMTPAMQAELTHLKMMVERAVADGRITADETDQIKRQIAADGQVTFQELELYRQLILDKISDGVLERDIE